jgi:hypothetical protein
VPARCAVQGCSESAAAQKRSSVKEQRIFRATRVESLLEEFVVMFFCSSAKTGKATGENRLFAAV